MICKQYGKFSFNESFSRLSDDDNVCQSGTCFRYTNIQDDKFCHKLCPNAKLDFEVSFVLLSTEIFLVHKRDIQMKKNYSGQHCFAWQSNFTGGNQPAKSRF